MIADKFTVEIELGNAAMQSYGDIAGALQTAAAGLGRAGPHCPTRGAEGKIYDANGNVVGKWRAL